MDVVHRTVTVRRGSGEAHRQIRPNGLSVVELIWDTPIGSYCNWLILFGGWRLQKIVLREGLQGPVVFANKSGTSLQFLNRKIR